MKSRTDETKRKNPGSGVRSANTWMKQIEKERAEKTIASSKREEKETDLPVLESKAGEKAKKKNTSVFVGNWINKNYVEMNYVSVSTFQ